MRLYTETQVRSQGVHTRTRYSPLGGIRVTGIPEGVELLTRGRFRQGKRMRCISSGRTPPHHPPDHLLFATALFQHRYRIIWYRFRCVYGRVLAVIGELWYRTGHV